MAAGSIVGDVVECKDVRIPIDPRIITPWVEKKLRRGRYETPETEAAPKFLSAGDRVMELGAGIGFFSTFIAKEIGVEAVHCVEANPRLSDFIRSVHALNGVETASVVSGVAISDAAEEPESGFLDFHIADPFFSSSLLPVRAAVEVCKTPTFRLSSAIREHDPTALVLDIEGGEREIFEGTDLGGVTKVFLELHKRLIRPSGVKKVFDDLSAQNFAYDQSISCGGMLLFRKVTG
ncbi:MAG: FkbM family methyltransferase [Pseudomonadota bacterium]